MDNLIETIPLVVEGAVLIKLLDLIPEVQNKNEEKITKVV